MSEWTDDQTRIIARRVLADPHANEDRKAWARDTLARHLANIAGRDSATVREYIAAVERAEGHAAADALRRAHAEARGCA